MSENRKYIDFKYGGHLVAETLKTHGVESIFTLCGGHISPILVACKDVGVQVIDLRHEANAVFAADATSRLSGIPGVAVVTAGPGVTNTITAVKNAQMAQSPVILIGGAAPTILKNRGSLQDIDQLTLMKSTVKWTASLKNAKSIVPTLEKAFKISQSDVPGPVFIEIPVDILYPVEIVRNMYGQVGSKGINNKLIQWYLSRHSKKLFQGTKSIRTPVVLNIQESKLKKSQIRKVKEIIQFATQPVLLIGSQALLKTNSVEELKHSVLKLGIPTYLSSMARGLLGHNESIIFKHERKKTLREADVVILAGVINDFRLDYGGHISKSSIMIVINRSKADLNLNRKPQIGILGDPGEFLIQIAQRIPNQSKKLKKWHELLRRREQVRESEISNQSKVKIKGLNPILLCKAIKEQISGDSIIIADGGDFIATASYIVQPNEPLRWLDPGVFGTLGSGAGFAIGAKLLKRNAEVWLLYGDGSAGYTLAEWDSFVRHNLPVIGVIGNDATWNQIAREQIEMFDDDVGVTLNQTAYEKVVAGFGAVGLELKSENDIEAILIKAKEIAQKGKPVLINAYIGKTDFRKGSISI